MQDSRRAGLRRSPRQGYANHWLSGLTRWITRACPGRCKRFSLSVIIARRHPVAETIARLQCGCRLCSHHQQHTATVPYDSLWKLPAARKAARITSRLNETIRSVATAWILNWRPMTACRKEDLNRLSATSGKGESKLSANGRLPGISSRVFSHELPPRAGCLELAQVSEQTAQPVGTTSGKIDIRPPASSTCPTRRDFVDRGVFAEGVGGDARTMSCTRST